jgi:hypothetical protein
MNMAGADRAVCLASRRQANSCHSPVHIEWCGQIRSIPPLKCIDVAFQRLNPR